MEFKRMDGTVVDSCAYVKEYVKKHSGIEIIVGSDSQNGKAMTSYATVIALYEPGHGAHIIFKRERTPRESNRQVRLLNEVYKSIMVADELRQSGIEGIKCVDIDINPDPKFKSNEVFKTACGLIEGMGFKVRYKTLCPLVTTMADTIARH